MTGDGADRSGRRERAGRWLFAYLVYVGFYALAIRLGVATGAGDALLAAFANSLPEGLLAPVVVAWVDRRVARLPTIVQAGRVTAGAAAFCLAGATGSMAAMTVVHRIDSGRWEFSGLGTGFVWKVFLDLLLFVGLAGVGYAGAAAREAREAEARAERAERLRAEARLAALRAHLNPHFILNVLHSLMSLAERDAAGTSAALERLGSALRFALRVQSRGMDEVPLRDELAFARDYLELERLRLGDRLTARVDSAAELADRPVLSFVVQPLVENAIQHAIAPRARGGTLAVGIRALDGGLELTVDDDGAAGVEGLARAAAGEGIGLRLLADRLRAVYGEAASLALEPSPLGGLRARVRLPAARAEGEAAGEGEA